MSFNGSGVFNVYTPGTPYVTGTTISSTVANNVNNDFANGLSTCVTKDGQQTITANIPMSGFKFTGLGAGTTAGDSVRYQQVVGTYLPLAGGTMTGPLLVPDSDLEIIGSSDATKIVKFEVDGLTTATTRTMTVPDINGTIAISGIGGASRKAQMSVTAASATGTFTADEIVVETALGGAILTLASYSQSCNLGTMGAGGMDAGTAPISGFVSLYAIAKPDGTKSILACAVATSTASIYGGANMPSGYTYSALIGIWPTNGSSQFIVGYIQDRKFFYQTYKSIFTGTTGSATLTTQSISAAVPTVARSVDMSFWSAALSTTFTWMIAADGTGTGGVVSALETTLGSTSTGIGGVGSVSVQSSKKDIPIITAQTIFWADILARASGSNMSVTAYTF